MIVIPDKAHGGLAGPLKLLPILSHFRWRITFTWLLVVAENLLLALIPLFTGRAIDALLARQTGALWEIFAMMAVLIVVGVIRHAYDTRSFGTIRIELSSELVSRMQGRVVSQVNARLEMGREMVNFLEEDTPELFTALVQMVVSVVILWSFGHMLGVSAILAILGLVVIYTLFHQRFYRLNGQLNQQKELQVAMLKSQQPPSLLHFLRRLRRCEVKLSDTEAVLYGLVFAVLFSFVLINLMLATSVQGISAGVIFTILSYSWELVESGIALPMVLQQWSRLSEIQKRLND